MSGHGVLMKKSFFLQFRSYILIGLFNTFLSLSVIFLMISYGYSDIFSNFIGFSFGVISSFFLNAKFTFSSIRISLNKFLRFILSVGFSYLMNLLVLVLCLQTLMLSSFISQLLALSTYVLVNFLLLRWVVFRDTNFIYDKWFL